MATETSSFGLPLSSGNTEIILGPTVVATASSDGETAFGLPPGAIETNEVIYIAGAPGAPGIPGIQGIQGITGPTGPSAGNFTEGEIPSGAINSSNINFSLTNIPSTNRDKLYLNGVRQKRTLDYTLSSNIITFISAPVPGDILLIDYNY